MKNEKIQDNYSKIDLHLKESIYHFIDIMTDKALICIENRQAYCDRGRYSVKIFPHNHAVLSIDHQDGFPRYYFNFTAMMTEIICFCNFRNIEILSIALQDAASNDN